MIKYTEAALLPRLSEIKCLIKAGGSSSKNYFWAEFRIKESNCWLLFTSQSLYCRFWNTDKKITVRNAPFEEILIRVSEECQEELLFNLDLFI